MVCQRRNDILLQATIMVMMISVKRFYEHGGEMQVAQDAPLKPSMDIFAVGYANGGMLSYYKLLLCSCCVSKIANEADLVEQWNDSSGGQPHRVFGSGNKKDAIISRQASMLEQSVNNTERMRESSSKRYRDFHIPWEWMFDTGLIGQLLKLVRNVDCKQMKLSSLRLAKEYMKRISKELKFSNECSQEQEQSGFVIETISAFEELEKVVNILHVAYTSQSHGQSSYSTDDLPKAVVMTLNQGSAVKRMDFHSMQQILLLGKCGGYNRWRG
ncbi:hypothetical protein Pint_16064 [Pistacia integerrima]|uniref:Uncharacterized protein n=1 Tax=Pistacia integerrima TaxID=434235 RepID=A0ACC0ZE84_9ROSI|nr:hypothetical protein Pint_16064 [Pistacia integerrima]